MKIRFLLPRFHRRALNAIACFLSMIAGFGCFFFGDIHHATFWATISIFNYLAYKI